jgi:hypothetical protein
MEVLGRDALFVAEELRSSECPPRYVSELSDALSDLLGVETRLRNISAPANAFAEVAGKRAGSAVRDHVVATRAASIERYAAR